MRSFGIYCKLDGQKSINAKIHVNLLKIKNEKTSCFLDFGLLFPIDIKELRFYFPFYIEIKDVEDLGSLLAKNNDVLDLIFHTDMSTSSFGQNCYTYVQSSNEEDSSFALYQLGENNLNIKHTNTSVSQQMQGTILNVQLKGEYSFSPACQDCEKKDKSKPKNCYIRFRIPVSNRNMDIFRHSANISDDLFQSAFSKIDMIDFRINDRREIDKKVLETLEDGSYKAFQFEEAHFFYVADSKENIRNGSVIHKDCRIMERERWNDYLPATENVNYLAYHWEKSNLMGRSLSEFCIFFNTIYPERNWLRILSYSFVVILLGFLGSMLSFDINNECEIVVKSLIVFIMFCFILWQFRNNKNY